MADEELGTGSVTITLDSGSAEGEAERLGDRLEEILNRASRDAGLRIQRNITRAIARINPATINVTADTSRFEAALNRLNNLGSAPLRVTPDVDRARFETAIQAALAGLEVSVRVVPDLTGFDAAIRAHNTPSVTVDVNADVDQGLSRGLSAVNGALSRLGGAATSALKIGAVGIAAAAAAQGVFALSAALAPAAGAIAALPAVIGGVVAANAALRLATAGVGDAMSALASGDAKALEAAMKNLSPAARSAVTTLQSFAPRLRAVQQSVQERFFQQFSGDIKGAVTNLLPLQVGLRSIATEFGKTVSEALKFASTREALAGLRQVLTGTDGALSGLKTAIGPVLKGFVDVAAAVSTAFGTRLGNSIGQAGAQFGTFLSGLAASGRAVELVRGAVQVFKQLGTIAGNVGGIISGVFKAANDVGGGLLNNLVQITGQFEAFVKSAQGQEAIGNIFRTLSTVAAQLGPILGALVTQLGAIAPALAPLFTTIGPAIVDVINAIGPALQALAPGVQALVTGLAGAIAAISDSGALEALGTAIGAIATAIAPVLPVVGQLVAALVGSLAPAVTGIATALAPVISAIAGALTPVLPPLTSAITTLVRAFTPLAVLLGKTIAQAITALSPVLTTLARVFQQIAVALAPLIVQITAGLAPLLAQLPPLVTQLVSAFLPLVQQLVGQLLPILPPLVTSFLAILNALVPLIPVVASLATAMVPVISNVLAVLGPAAQFLATVLQWATLNVVVPVIEKIVSALTGIVSAVTGVITGIANFVSTVIGFFQNLYNVLVGNSIIPDLINGIVSWFAQLPGRILGVVSGMISSVISFFAALPGRVRGAVSSVVSVLTGVFNSARTAVVSRVTSLVSTAVGIIRSLPGQARAALGNLAGFLLSAGGDLVQGFINGIKSKLGSLRSAAAEVANAAKNAVTGLLDISSPSKVFIEIGKFLVDGFVKGMTGERPAIKAAADKLVQQITNAFKGRNTRLDDALIASIRAGQRQLEALADQRTAIAEKIKQANELATQTTQSALQAFGLQNISRDGTGIQSLTTNLTAAVDRIRTFNKQINELGLRGLRKDLLSQIIGLGPDQGADIATSLANATDRQLAELNEAQRQLDAASKKLGQDSADALFDAGANAAKGFLAGLRGQQKDIQNLMLQIARSMSTAIRTALKIASPSRVFRRIGRFTMDGLNAGVTDRVGNVRRSVLDAARALADPFGAGPALSAGAFSVRPAAVPAPRAAAAGSPVTINLNGTGYTDADAQRIVNRIVSLAGL